MIARRILLLLALAAWGAPAAAQAPAAPAPAVTFLPRADFAMGAERLFDPDPRFDWDANFGGELDLVDYGVGRLTFFANYQVVLGDELRVFDPNQGNYVLEGALSARLPLVEVATVFYHQSRHLSDREKADPIDWNMVGVRARRAWLAGAFHVDTRVDVRGTVQRSFVDYRWELDARARADRVVRPGTGVFVSGMVRRLGVDGSRGRGDQTGVRAEGGVRVDGRAGAVELFVAGERRIDPDPREVGTGTWATAGFRLMSR